MTWVLIIAVSWLVVSVVAAFMIAGTIHLADQRRKAAQQTSHDNFVVDLHAVAEATSSGERAAESRRPVPPARQPVVRDCIPPSERVTRTRQTGTR
jgi:predicted membrane-bound mannosyltransferase